MIFIPLSLKRLKIVLLISLGLSSRDLDRMLSLPFYSLIIYIFQFEINNIFLKNFILLKLFLSIQICKSRNCCKNLVQTMMVDTLFLLTNKAELEYILDQLCLFLRVFLLLVINSCKIAQLQQQLREYFLINKFFIHLLSRRMML